MYAHPIRNFIKMKLFRFLYRNSYRVENPETIHTILNLIIKINMQHYIQRKSVYIGRGGISESRLCRDVI